MKTYRIRAPWARKLPDPVFGTSKGIEWHYLFVPLKDVPEGIPLDPNAREPKINRSVYRQVEDSMLDVDAVPGTFHMKHRGIRALATAVKQTDDHHYDVLFDDGEGIVDGGHSYELVLKHRELGDLPENQFIKFEIETKVDPLWIPDLARGLNTSVQVQAFSLDNLAGLFDWIKDELKSEPYFDDIAWKEGEAGAFDARDIISVMTCFNIDLYPNTSDSQPVEAYEKKSAALQQFEQHQESFRKVRPILRDLLVLHDTIRMDVRDIWNNAGGRAGNFAFMEKRTRGEFQFPFIGKTAKYRLMNGALYPMLASLRWMVDKDINTGDFCWRGDFGAVLKRWEESAVELIRMTQQSSEELGRNATAIGKSRSLWANLHARIAMRDLMQKSGAAAA